MAVAEIPVVFEQPLTERVRVFLRLEFLFGQYRHHRRDASEYGTRATLHVLLDILSVLSRSDLKNDILKELSEQHAALTRLAQRPGIDPDSLKSVLDELTAAVNGMQQLATQFAGNLMRENDFLITVANRYGMLGGTCGFDLPTLHYWLSQSRAGLERDLDAWSADMRPFEQAILLYLRLLRQSREPEAVVVQRGMHIHNPPGVCHLLRVHVLRSVSAYPEISASRHRFSIRFMSARDINARSQQLMVDIPFDMQCCVL